MFFIFFIFNTLTLVFIHQVNSTGVVEQLNKWPVPIESLVEFIITIPYKEKSLLFVKVVNDEGTVLSPKLVKITKKYYVDLSTDYFIIKKEKKIISSDNFLLTMSFYTKSYGHYLVLEWNEIGDINGKNAEIYKQKISLTKDWRIDIKVQVLEYIDQKTVYVDQASYFQPGKKIKISCNAFDGLPPTEVYVNDNLTKKFRDVSYDKNLNQWTGYLTLSIDDHNRSLSCQVRGSNQNQSYNIIVNHPTTSVKLTPEYDGYVKNGTRILCQPFDGYPIPIMNWVFVSAKNHSKPDSLFDIKNNELGIRSNIPVGTQLEFNCTAVYKNPLDDEISTVTRTFSFIVGDKPNNISLHSKPFINIFQGRYATLNMAAIGAAVAGMVIMIIAVTIVIMLCRSKPKPSRASSNQQQGSPKYAGSLLAGSKAALRNQVKNQNGSNNALMTGDSSTAVNNDQNELNYDDMPRGRRPIKVVDDPVIYSTIVGTMQPKSRPSLDFGPIDRV